MAWVFLGRARLKAGVTKWSCVTLVVCRCRRCGPPSSPPPFHRLQMEIARNYHMTGHVIHRPRSARVPKKKNSCSTTPKGNITNHCPTTKRFFLQITHNGWWIVCHWQKLLQHNGTLRRRDGRVGRRESRNLVQGKASRMQTWNSQKMMWNIQYKYCLTLEKVLSDVPRWKYSLIVVFWLSADLAVWRKVRNRTLLPRGAHLQKETTLRISAGRRHHDPQFSESSSCLDGWVHCENTWICFVIEIDQKKSQK